MDRLTDFNLDIRVVIKRELRRVTGDFCQMFTALHGMQTRSSDENNSVRLSVSLSDKRVDCNETEEKSVQIFIPYERPFSLVF